MLDNFPLINTGFLSVIFQLYFQLDIVCPGKFDTFNKFVRRYCDAREVYYRGKRHFDTRYMYRHINCDAPLPK